MHISIFHVITLSWVYRVSSDINDSAIKYIKTRGVSDVGFSIFADTDADFAF